MGTRPFKTEPDIDTFRMRITEMASSISRESDLADSLYLALISLKESRGINFSDIDSVMDAIDRYEEARVI